jgi:hypothetical protein
MPTEIIKVGILGAGGLGSAAAQILNQKQEMELVAISDRSGFAFDPEGLDVAAVLKASSTHGSVGYTPQSGKLATDTIRALIERSHEIDAFFIALPNLPNDFIPSVIQRFALGGYDGEMVDALKRTGAVELVFKLEPILNAVGMTCITGAGATPGLLTAAAALASQSFQEIQKVEVYFGVGISNWDAYRATIREDIAHLDGFDVERVARMTDEEIEAELERRDGILELVDMEHADDVILEYAGIVDRKQVTVGGIVDTRHPKKPVSTTVKITGRTFEGKVSTHVFTLGDETSMAANVCGPAFGYMKTGIWLNQRGIYGVLSSADVMPRFVK